MQQEHSCCKGRQRHRLAIRRIRLHKPAKPAIRQKRPSFRWFAFFRGREPRSYCDLLSVLVLAVDGELFLVVADTIDDGLPVDLCKG